MTLSLPAGKIIGLLGPNGSGKTTLIKLINGLLHPTTGEIVIDGYRPSVDTKKIISYLPDTSYLREDMKIKDALAFFEDFYEDFSREKAEHLLEDLELNPNDILKIYQKGIKKSAANLGHEPTSETLYSWWTNRGVDPAARDYILRTIINNYCEEASVIISTHLISEIEPILDEIIFLKDGKIILQGNTDDIREEHGQSIDSLFRETYKA